MDWLDLELIKITETLLINSTHCWLLVIRWSPLHLHGKHALSIFVRVSEILSKDLDVRNTSYIYFMFSNYRQQPDCSLVIK